MMIWPRLIPLVLLSILVSSAGCAPTRLAVAKLHTSTNDPTRVLAVGARPTWIAVQHGEEDVWLFGELFKSGGNAYCLSRTGEKVQRTDLSAVDGAPGLYKCTNAEGKLIAVVVEPGFKPSEARSEPAASSFEPQDGTVCVSPCNRPGKKKKWRDVVVVGGPGKVAQ